MPPSSILSAALDAYRRSGADLPFGDPIRPHGIAMEGYYWRFTDVGAGRVIVVLCGVCTPSAVARSGSLKPSWALVALASHPGGFVRHRIVPHVDLGERGAAVVAGSALNASPDELRIDLGPDARLTARIAERRRWPRQLFGGLGVAQSAPSLAQYWHPHLLGAQADGEAVLGGEPVLLEGANVYAEKNWGRSFPARWWWGQAQGFDGHPSICAAFAGGRIQLGQLSVAPTSVVVALPGRVLQLAPPLALTRTRVAPGFWHVQARSGGVRVELEGEAHEAVALPVPIVDERRAEMRSQQALAGRMRLEVRQRSRVLFRGESRLAGLEREVWDPLHRTSGA
ncbi:MAG: tocopherol cyclase family protein [Actinomycetota bacterium]|nr:tocopherol cyclase family protein [Actinomycetota bacterium]